MVNLAIKTVLAFALMALLAFMIVFLLAPGFEQMQYNDKNMDIRLNGLAGELTQDCRALASAHDSATIKGLRADIVARGGPPLDLNQMGMPETTRTCVINVIHEEARR